MPRCVYASTALFAALVAACGPAAPVVRPAGAAAEGPLRYEVTPREGGARLSVVATLPPGLPDRFHVEPAMVPWVEGIEVETVGGWRGLPFSGGVWTLPACPLGCRVRYDYDLAGAAAGAGHVGYAAEHGGAFLAPPSTWLLHPAEDVAGRPFRLHVHTSPEVGFVTGLFPVDGATATYGADLSDLPEAPYSAFGRLDFERMRLDRGELDVAFANGPAPDRRPLYVTWIRESARAVSGYYGRFPIPHAAVIVLVEEGGDIGYATALGNGGGGIVARVGGEVPERRLLHSWQMTHELLHMAFPNLARKHRWLEEGMATYVEPLARARIGAVTEDEVWRGMLKGAPYGLPRPGEGGLDDTPTWGRTYWGGALFLLLADVRIRDLTANARSLDDALRAVLDRGGNASVRWPIERVLRIGDEATGTTVLSDLHAEMGHKAAPIDLADLWARLGIRIVGDALSFDDAAPLAHVRKAMIAPPTRPAQPPGAGPSAAPRAPQDHLSIH